MHHDVTEAMIEAGELAHVEHSPDWNAAINFQAIYLAMQSAQPTGALGGPQPWTETMGDPVAEMARHLHEQADPELREVVKKVLWDCKRGHLGLPPAPMPKERTDFDDLAQAAIDAMQPALAAQKARMLSMVEPWLAHKTHCLAQRDLHSDAICRCGLNDVLQMTGQDYIDATVAQIADFLDGAAKAAVGSGGAFNQGVVRGLEIAAAQVRSGHALAPHAKGAALNQTHKEGSR